MFSCCGSRFSQAMGTIARKEINQKKDYRTMFQHYASGGNVLNADTKGVCLLPYWCFLAAKLFFEEGTTLEDVRQTRSKFPVFLDACER